MKLIIILVLILIVFCILCLCKNKKLVRESFTKTSEFEIMEEIVLNSDKISIEDVKFNLTEYILQLILDNYALWVDEETAGEKQYRIYDFRNRIKFMNHEDFEKEVDYNFKCDHEYEEKCYFLIFTIKETIEGTQFKIKIAFNKKKEEDESTPVGISIKNYLNDDTTKTNRNLDLILKLRCREDRKDLVEELNNFVDSKSFEEFVNNSWFCGYTSPPLESGYYHSYSDENKRKQIEDKYDTSIKNNILCQKESDLKKKRADLKNIIKVNKENLYELIDIKTYLCIMGAYENLDCETKPYYYNQIRKAHLYHPTECCFKKQKDKFDTLFCESGKELDVRMCQNYKNNIHKKSDKSCESNLPEGALDLSNYKHKLCKKIREDEKSDKYDWSKYSHYTDGKTCDKCYFDFNSFFKCYEGFEGFQGSLVENFSCENKTLTTITGKTILFNDDPLNEKGRNCKDYEEQGLCADNKTLATYPNPPVKKNYMNKEAKEMCCVCGGGLRSPSSSEGDTTGPGSSGNTTGAEDVSTTSSGANTTGAEYGSNTFSSGDKTTDVTNFLKIQINMLKNHLDSTNIYVSEVKKQEEILEEILSKDSDNNFTYKKEEVFKDKDLKPIEISFLLKNFYQKLIESMSKKIEEIDYVNPEVKSNFEEILSKYNDKYLNEKFNPENLEKIDNNYKLLRDNIINIKNEIINIRKKLNTISICLQSIVIDPEAKCDL